MTPDIKESIRYLTEFAASNDMDYRQLMTDANNCIDDDYDYIKGEELTVTFWEHFETVTGRAKAESNYFSCGC